MQSGFYPELPSAGITVTITSGQAAFTTSGAALQSADIRRGDVILRNGFAMTIATITGQNAGTLEFAAPADAAGTGQLRIALKSDATRATAKHIALLASLSGGNAQALAELPGAANKLPIFTGPGTMGLIDAGDLGTDTPATTVFGSPAVFTGTDGKSIGIGNEITPPQITVNQNNYAPTGISTATLVRLSSDAARTITGIGTSGSRRQMTLVNVGSHPITLAHATGSASDFQFSIGADIVLLPGNAVTIFYDATPGRWRARNVQAPAFPDAVRFDIDQTAKSSGEKTQARANIGANVLGGFKNKLINALGLVNQRGYTSGAATIAANQYTIDRWRVVVSGQNLSWTTSAGVRTFTAPAGGIEEVIEGSCILSGTYVLNWEGTATATVNGTPRTKGEPFSLTGGANVTVRFIGGTWGKPQLEQGAVTDFEVRHPQQELALCQRYFFSAPASQLPLIGYRYMSTARTGCDMGSVFLPVAMRTTPTITMPTLTFQGCSNLTIGGECPTGWNMRVDVAAAGQYRTFNLSDPYTADAEL